MEGFACILPGACALAVHGMVNPMVPQNASQEIYVGEVRDVLEGQAILCQQARDHQRQGGVLRARYGNRPLEALATFNLDAVHERPVREAEPNVLQAKCARIWIASN